MISFLGPIYHGKTTEEKLGEWKKDNIACGMRMITGNTIDDLKNKLCLLVDDGFDKFKFNEFKECAISRGITIDDQKIVDLVRWMKSPNDFSERHYKDLKNYPINLSTLLLLSSRNNLPPRTVNEFKIWEKNN